MKTVSVRQVMCIATQLCPITQIDCEDSRSDVTCLHTVSALAFHRK